MISLFSLFQNRFHYHRGDTSMIIRWLF